MTMNAICFLISSAFGLFNLFNDRMDWATVHFIIATMNLVIYFGAN